MVEHPGGKIPSRITPPEECSEKKKPPMEMDGLNDCLPCEKS